MARASIPSRIVRLTDETTATLYLLGEQRRIVGVSSVEQLHEVVKRWASGYV